jgi:integrase
MRDGISIWKSEKHGCYIFQVSFRDLEGKRKRIQRRAKTKSEAERRALDLARSPELQTSREIDVKIADLLDKYINEQRPRIRSSSLGNSVHLIQLYLLPVLGSQRVSTVKVDAIEQLLLNLYDRGLAVGTVNTVRVKAHALFQFAMRKGLISENPVRLVRPFVCQGEDKTQVRSPWTAVEARAALAAFRGTNLEVFLSLALATGMRKGEILALRWKDINFENSTIRVQRSRGERKILTTSNEVSIGVIEGPTKTSSSNRVLAMSQGLFRVLWDEFVGRQNSGSVDPEQHVILGVKGKPISISYLTKSFNCELEKSSIRRIRIHDIRHTVATLALEHGAPLEEVSQGFGHKGIEVTKRIYGSSVQGLADRFVDRVSQALFD